LSKDGHQVTVDISTVSHETLKEDSLFQVIGELEHFDDQVSKVEMLSTMTSDHGPLNEQV
jgi:hypothetical protein